MSLESLIPVSEEAILSMVLRPKQALGRNIEIHTKQFGFPEIQGCKIAIIGLEETRNSFFPVNVYQVYRQV